MGAQATLEPPQPAQRSRVGQSGNSFVVALRAVRNLAPVQTILKVGCHRRLKSRLFIDEVLGACNDGLVPVMSACVAVETSEVFAERCNGYEIALTFLAHNDGL